MWSELYDQNRQPALNDIENYIDSPLFSDFCSFLESSYGIAPRFEYSRCSMQKGWNIKYKKRGKSLCTIYPMKDYFIVLVVIGEKELNEAEMLAPVCCEYIQRLLTETPFSLGGKWLMIEVRDQAVLDDVQKLVQLRVISKKGK